MVETLKIKQVYFESAVKSETSDASFETDLSYSSDKVRSSQTKIIRPKDTKHLFNFPNGLESSYEKLFNKVEEIIEEIQNKVNFASVRDDCSVKPKSVMLLMPIRKKSQ